MTAATTTWYHGFLILQNALRRKCIIAPILQMGDLSLGVAMICKTTELAKDAARI